MQKTSTLNLYHTHEFTAHNHRGEKHTVYVLLLTFVTMFAEIIAGSMYGSMALLADGWHMGTHVAAFCITLFAYRYAKQHSKSDLFSFGTGKISVLGGYTSAIALGIVALVMFAESIYRLFHPQPIQFNEAIIVAIIGLIVNVISMFLLHDHHRPHDHHDHHDDHNLKAAYMHVLADTLTSLLAIVALFIGKYFGFNWLDSIMGMVGAIVITKWTLNLMKQTRPILLDASIDKSEKEAIIVALQPYAEIADLHIWKISADHYSAAITLVSFSNKTLADYQQLLAKFDKIHHLTLELHTQDS